MKEKWKLKFRLNTCTYLRYPYFIGVRVSKFVPCSSPVRTVFSKKAGNVNSSKCGIVYEKLNSMACTVERKEREEKRKKKENQRKMRNER